MQDPISKNRWLASAFLPFGILLLALVLAKLGGKLPALPETAPRSIARTNLIPVTRIEGLFSTSNLTGAALSTNAANPFFTTYFQPRPAPKPPSVQKIELVYQGYYQNASGEKQAFVKVGGKLVVAALGTNVVGDFEVVEINPRHLLLKNKAAQTNVLEFNAKKQVEVPTP